MATLGTLAGALFSHYILFPSSVAMFSQLNPPHTKFMPRIEDTFGPYKNMLIGMVAVFQLPTLVFFLARLRLVMYVASIGIAWLVRPRGDEARTESDGASGLGLLISAAVFEQARKQRASSIDRGSNQSSNHRSSIFKFSSLTPPLLSHFFRR
jgi:hypothetical protein